MIKKIITWFKSFRKKAVKDAQKSNVDVVKSFLSSEKNKKDAKILAQSVQISCGNHWFSAKKMSSKFRIPYPEAIRKLELLCAFNLCASKDFGVKKHYKILLDETVRKDLIQIEIDQCLERIEVLKKQL